MEYQRVESKRLAINSCAQVRSRPEPSLQTCASASNHEPQTTNNKLKLSSFLLLLASCFLLLSPSPARAQDPNFSQFEMNPLYYNPAYAGSVTDLRFGINYRNLWLNVPGMKFPGPLSPPLAQVFCVALEHGRLGRIYRQKTFRLPHICQSPKI